MDLASLAGGLLPGAVVVAEAFHDLPDADLFPEEEIAVHRAVEARRREFATGRRLARDALRRLGVGPVAVPAGEDRAPRWPPGVVGSITHCAGYRAAVVAHDTAFVTVGIDAEPNEPLPDDILEVTSLAAERAWVGDLLRADPSVRWDRLLFTVKESVYKAWFPLTHRWLEFTDASVRVDPRSGAFHADLLVAGPTLPGGVVLRGFTGRWRAQQGLLLSAIAVPSTIAG